MNQILARRIGNSLGISFDRDPQTFQVKSNPFSCYTLHTISYQVSQLCKEWEQATIKRVNEEFVKDITEYNEHLKQLMTNPNLFTVQSLPFLDGIVSVTNNPGTEGPAELFIQIINLTTSFSHETIPVEISIGSSLKTLHTMMTVLKDCREVICGNDQWGNLNPFQIIQQYERLCYLLDSLPALEDESPDMDESELYSLLSSESCLTKSWGDLGLVEFPSTHPDLKYS